MELQAYLDVLACGCHVQQHDHLAPTEETQGCTLHQNLPPLPATNKGIHVLFFGMLTGTAAVGN